MEKKGTIILMVHPPILKGKNNTDFYLWMDEIDKNKLRDENKQVIDLLMSAWNGIFVENQL